MKYYKIDYKGIFKEENKVLGQTNGEFVRKDEIIEDTPVFDYFHLQRIDRQLIKGNIIVASFLKYKK